MIRPVRVFRKLDPKFTDNIGIWSRGSGESEPSGTQPQVNELILKRRPGRQLEMTFRFIVGIQDKYVNLSREDKVWD